MENSPKEIKVLIARIEKISACTPAEIARVLETLIVGSGLDD